jgi:hypothetical protein
VEDFRQACLAWMGNPDHRRPPHPGELKALLDAVLKAQRPPPPRMPRDELDAILGGLKPGLR